MRKIFALIFVGLFVLSCIDNKSTKKTPKVERTILCDLVDTLVSGKRIVTKMMSDSSLFVSVDSSELIIEKSDLPDWVHTFKYRGCLEFYSVYSSDSLSQITHFSMFNDSTFFVPAYTDDCHYGICFLRFNHLGVKLLRLGLNNNVEIKKAYFSYPRIFDYKCKVFYKVFGSYDNNNEEKYDSYLSYIGEGDSIRYLDEGNFSTKMKYDEYVITTSDAEQIFRQRKLNHLKMFDCGKFIGERIE